PLRPTRVADVHGDVPGRQAQLLRHHHGHGGLEAGADVLRALEDLHRSVAMDLHLRAHAAAARDHVPVAVGHADATLARAGRVAGLLVAALPADGPGPRLVLEQADRARFVLPPQLEGIHAELLRQLVHGRLDGEGALRMAGRAQGRGGPGVREDVVLLDQAVRRVRIEGTRGPARARATRDAGRAERAGVDGGGHAVPLRPPPHRQERRRRVARAEVLLVAGQHELDRRARLLRELAGHAREVRALRGGGQLRTEPAAHVVRDDGDVLAVDAQVFGHALAHGRDAL